MSTKDKLQIILITYNRINCLKTTLNKLISQDSPIKDFDITILDNTSTDGTMEFCEEFVQTHSNFRYIRNKYNVGISGNIIKAMEMANKKWLWVICDDDDYDWTNWAEVEEALLSNEYDIVHTTYSDGFRNETYPYLINEEAFIPTAIYNTKHINSTTMQNANIMAYTLLPHHAIGIKVINENGKIFVPQVRHVIQGTSEIEEKDWVRQPRAELFYKLNDYQLLVGYLEAYQLIKDEKLRDETCNVLCLGQDFKNSMYWFLETNPNRNLKNIFTILNDVSDSNKKDLIEAIKDKNYPNFDELIDKISYYKKDFYFESLEFFKNTNKRLEELQTQNKILIKDINSIKHKLNTSFIQQIFSIKNENQHKVVRILGIKLKFRR